MAGGVRRLARAVRGCAAAPDVLARGFVVLVCASVLGIVAWRVGLARDLRLQESRTGTANLARALAEHARGTMEMADVILAGLVERVEHDGAAPPALDRLRRHMEARVDATARLRSLLVVGPDGARLAGTLPPSAPDQDGSGPDAAGRDYFTRHRDGGWHGLHIGPPMRSRRDGAWIIPLSRRVGGPDGAFGGVVVAMVGFDTFARFYASFEVGPQGAILLANDDGTLLVRAPPVPAAVGTSLLGGSIFQDYRRSGLAGSTTGVSRLDGVRRWNSFRKVDGYPLVVFASLSEADILAGWRGSAAVALGSAGAVSLALGLLGWRLADQIRRRHQAEAGTRQREGQYRLLADHGTDMVVMLDAGWRQTYVSPASLRLLGHAPDAMAGLDMLAFVHPDDRAAVRAGLDALFAGGAAEPVRCRALRRDGSWLWVEALGRQVPGGPDAWDAHGGGCAVRAEAARAEPAQAEAVRDEAIRGGGVRHRSAGSAVRGAVILSVRDVSARKTAEDALHHANNQLQRLVMQDGLTGISNRRCFDAVLAREGRRAARAGLPLALLLVDVDRFKPFNDRYGHPAGDACLRAVAEAVSQGAQRPADLAARYGGEEFAVLLPDTDLAGAATLAERVRDAVRRLAIPHDAVPGGHVTASIGAAVVWPGRHQDLGQDAADLVGLADQALYRAKAEGRNRVCFGGAPLQPGPDAPAAAYAT